MDCGSDNNNGDSTDPKNDFIRVNDLFYAKGTQQSNRKILYNESAAYWGSPSTSRASNQTNKTTEKKMKEPRSEWGDFEIKKSQEKEQLEFRKAKAEKVKEIRRDYTSKWMEEETTGAHQDAQNFENLIQSIGNVSLSSNENERGRLERGAKGWKRWEQSSKSLAPSLQLLVKPTDPDDWRSKSPTRERLLKLERQANVFSKYYGNDKKQKKSSGATKDTKTQKALRKYKHEDGLRFAVESYEWLTNSMEKLPVLQRQNEPRVPCFEPAEDELFALYRVIVEREDGRYILMACHLNLHGLHRGDLRFVEVNDRTKVKGIECSVFQGLFIGDIVAVLELAVNNYEGFVENISAKKVTHDSKCSWMVKKMTLMPRELNENVTFSFLESRKAIVCGYDETMGVQESPDQPMEVGKVYSGSAFIPEKLEHRFTVDFGVKHKNAILAVAAKLSTFPNAFGVIYEYCESADENDYFLVGTQAFDQNFVFAYNRDDIVETCAIMGYSAANALFNGRFDCRAFTMLNLQRHGNMLRFQMENPERQPTLGYWNANTKIVFGGPEGDFNATIETVVAADDCELLNITARVSRDVPRDLDFSGSFIVSQREQPTSNVLEKGFFQFMDPGSNGRKVIETLYGGHRLELKPLAADSDLKGPFVFPGSPPVSLNKYQNEYITMLLNDNPMVIGSSPFGCGKSMTIVTAALELHKRNSERSVLRNEEQQLLVTQSNYASVNLIEIARKAHLIDADDVRFVRFVSDRNWREMPENCQTDYDMPLLMQQVFKRWALGEESRESRMLHQDQMINMVAFILEKNLVAPREFQKSAISVYKSLGENRKPIHRTLVEAFFLLYRPDIIMITADTAQTLLKGRLLRNVSTVQIDEASQLPEYTLLSLLASFPHACFGLIGDINQLPPFCREDLSGKLKEFGIGNTMERAIQKEMFPQATLRYIYRCHPKSTQLLSELFYEGDLLSGVTENMRNEFMRNRPDLWPNAEFPLMVIDNREQGYKMGTSIGNASEVEMVSHLIDRIVQRTPGGYCMKPEDVGVISFYAAQTSILSEALRGTGVKCGTVDSFQGTEREVIILCCTNERPSEFMQLANRLNVAMSRARQVTIIVGNVPGLRKARYWETIVKRVEQNGCLIDGIDFLDQFEISNW